MVKANKEILKAHAQIKKMKVETAKALEKAKADKIKVMEAAKEAMKKVKAKTEQKI